MNKTYSLRFNRLFWATGLTAIVAGASLSAFTAQSPTSLAMWASAYLVLVVGLAQICLGVSTAQLVAKSSGRQVWWVYGLFNAGNGLTLIGTASKYSDYQSHLTVTVLAALLVVAAMSLLAWLIRRAKGSWLKTASYCLITLLSTSSLLGIVLASL